MVFVPLMNYYCATFSPQLPASWIHANTPFNTLCSDHQVGIRVIDRRAQRANLDDICVGALDDR